MLRNNSKQSGNPCSEYLRRRNEGLQWEGFAEKEGFKRGVSGRGTRMRAICGNVRGSNGAVVSRLRRQLFSLSLSLPPRVSRSSHIECQFS